MTEDPFAAWPAGLRERMEAGRWNGCVGSTLLSESDRVRVWHLLIPAGGWIDFHRHVLSYFWTALGNGRTRNYTEDGNILERDITEGLTQHREFAAGEYQLHAVQNVGAADLHYTTVEFLGGPNPPLPVPDAVRRAA